MAQRAIHYLFGAILSEHIEVKDKKRFLMGHVFPDSIEKCNRDKAHFEMTDDMQAYYDFEDFRSKYQELMQQDDFYLGYYMHLVEDALYRTFIYQDRFTMPRTREEVKVLHNDYHILNSYIVRKYNIHNILENDTELKYEPIGGIENFLIRDSLKKIADEFTEQTPGTTIFLTEPMVDEFIGTYIPLALEEVNKSKNGTSILRSSDYTWLRKR